MNTRRLSAGFCAGMMLALASTHSLAAPTEAQKQQCLARYGHLISKPALRTGDACWRAMAYLMVDSPSALATAPAATSQAVASVPTASTGSTRN